MHWYFFDELARERHQRLVTQAAQQRRALPVIRRRWPSAARHVRGSWLHLPRDPKRSTAPRGGTA